MTTPVIIDIIVAAVLAAFVICCAVRGLLRAIAGLAVFLVALVGAGMVANALSGPAAQLVTPLIRDRIEIRVEDAMAQRTPEVQMPEEDLDDGFEIADILALMGLDEDVRGSLTERAQEKIRDTGASIASAVVESVAQSVLYAALFFLAFVLLTLLLKLLVRTLDAVLRLPGLNLLNTLGGAVVGGVEGILFLFLAIWLLRRFGVSFETETVSETHILRFFTTHTPLDMLSFLE